MEDESRRIFRLVSDILGSKKEGLKWMREPRWKMKTAFNMIDQGHMDVVMKYIQTNLLTDNNS
jgi:hypothetical protein